MNRIRAKLLIFILIVFAVAALAAPTAALAGWTWDGADGWTWDGTSGVPADTTPPADTPG
jgi:hypothetical protein